MSTINYLQTNFNAGEISPRAYGRPDIQKYANALKRFENFYCTLQGGAFKRTGSYFAAGTKDSSKESFVKEFIFSTTQAYMLEYGDQYIRFFKDNGQIESTKVITGAADNGSGLIRITAVAHGYQTGNTVTITGVTGTTEANGTWVITVISADTYDLIGSTFTNAYVSGGSGTAIVEVSTPYVEANLGGLSYTQSADILYNVHQTYEPRKLTRSSHTAWSLNVIDFIDGPYLSINKTSTTFTPSGTTGSITITASAATFTANDVGRWVRIKHSAVWGAAKITAFTSSTVVDATVNADFPMGATGAVKEWRLGAFYIGNYPSCVSFYEERLCFSGCPDDPESVYCSETGNFETFSPTDKDAKVLDTSAITFKIVSDNVNAVQWMSGLNAMLLGSSGAEWKIDSGNDSKAFTPTTVTRKLQTTNGSAFGSKKTPIVVTNNAVLYVNKTGQEMYEIIYDNVLQGYKSNPLTILSEHILREGGYVVDTAFQKSRNSIIWAALADGRLAALTYLPDQEVAGWSKHYIGGTLAGELNAFVESVACIPTSDGSQDQLWMVVRRTIDGTTKRYIEYLKPDFLPLSLTDKDDAFYVDCGLTYNDPKTITAATQASPVSITSASHGFSTGDRVRIRSIKGMTELNGLNFTITVVNSNTFTLDDIDGTDYSEYVSGGVVRKHVSTVSGLDHLEGETVRIFADGGLQTDKTVSGGSITLDYPASFIHAGLGYRASLTTLPTEGGGNNGTAQGKFKRNNRCVVRLLNSMELRYKADEYSNDLDEYQNYNFREQQHIMDEAPQLFTNDVELDLLSEYTRQGTITLISDDPLPLNILALMPEGKVYG